MLWTVDPAAPAPLGKQIAADVRRAIAEQELTGGERLPPARELATMLGVHANTVLGAYRRLREEGLVDFRRGRGVSVSANAAPSAAISQAAHHLLELGRHQGRDAKDLAALLTRLAPKTS